MKPIVIIESPYAGDVARNVAYARRAVRHSILRGEAPYASHLLYTQDGILNDLVPEERAIGMFAGQAFTRFASLVAVYSDLGISGGMEAGIRVAKVWDVPIEYRKIGI